MPAKNLPLSTDPEIPPDWDVITLQHLAEDAGDAETVRLCDAALRNYASARPTVGMELKIGPHAEAFRALHARHGEAPRKVTLREVLADPSRYEPAACIYAPEDALPLDLDDDAVLLPPAVTRANEFAGMTVVVTVHAITRLIEKLEAERGRRATPKQRWRAVVEMLEKENALF